MKKIITIILLLAVTLGVSAQQDPQFTQYMYNPVVINPAYAGNRGVLSVVGLHRSQWVGLDGAPRTQSLSAHAPISNSRVGLGLSVLNDEIGPADETYLTADFSYTIPVGDEAKFSFGIKAGAHLLNVDFNQLDIFDPSDPRLQGGGVDNLLSPTLGLGLYYHSKKFYIGLSVPNLLQTDHFDESRNSATSFIAQERMHYFMSTGYVFNLSDSVKFKPATMFKMVPGAPLQWDASANFLFNDKVTVGAAYRWSAAVSGLVGFQLNDQLMIGFAYDRETTELGNAVFNDGSYELFMRFELFNNVDKIITPRFF